MSKRSDIIYGIRTVIEAVKAGQHLERVFIQKNLKGDLVKELMPLLHQSKTPVSKVPVERINKFTRKNHQGVLALVSPIQYASLEHIIPSLYEEGKNPLIVILDQITDVRNFGAISRTAECLGADCLVIPNRGGAQVNEDAIKASAGALNHLPIVREQSLLEAIEFLKGSGIKVFGVTEKGSKKPTESDLTGPVAAVLGSEEYGISSEVLDACDEKIVIPMLGNIESLNVSVAAGMVLYEVWSQRDAS